MALSKFQATQLFVESSLVFCTPFNEIIALDPGAGAQKWRFESHTGTKQRPAELQLSWRRLAWISRREH
jgi:quinoprotein glucose dehydrogenase